MDTEHLKAQITYYAKEMRLPTFKEYETLIRQAQDTQQTYEYFLLSMMKNEYESRKLNQQKRRIKAARFPYQKSLDEFDTSRLKAVNPNTVYELASCEFIDQKENIIMIGNPGTGKTHLSIAIGLKACYKGYRVLFSTAANLAISLVEAESNHRLSKMLTQLSKVDLLILDELSYLSFNKYQSELLFQVISDRSERGSIIMSTNLEFSKWDEFFPDTMMTAALIDRITFRSSILNMNGESYRFNEALK